MIQEKQSESVGCSATLTMPEIVVRRLSSKSRLYPSVCHG